MTFERVNAEGVEVVKALQEIRALRFRQHEGRDDFYSGAPMFIRAWLIADKALNRISGVIE